MKRSLEVTVKVGILMICVILFFTSWKLISGMAGQPGGKYEAVMAMLAGKYAINFWVFEMGAGMLLPLALYILSKGKDMKLMLIASVSMIIGIFIMRFDLVTVGQAVPVFHELGVNEFKHLLSYVPSLYEMIITAGGFGLTALLFLLGEKIFDGHKVEHH